MQPRSSAGPGPRAAGLSVGRRDALLCRSSHRQRTAELAEPAQLGPGLGRPVYAPPASVGQTDALLCRSSHKQRPAELAEPVRVLELEPIDTCREWHAEAQSSSSPLSTRLPQEGLPAVQLDLQARLEQILPLAPPALLPRARLLAADCVSRGMPSFDTLHRVSTEI